MCNGYQFCFSHVTAMDSFGPGYASDSESDSSSDRVPAAVGAKRARREGPQASIAPRKSHTAAQMCGLEPREYRACKRAKLPGWFFIGLATMHIVAGISVPRDSDGLDLFGGTKHYSESMSSTASHVLPYEINDDNIFQDINSAGGWTTLLLHGFRCRRGSFSIAGIVCSTWSLGLVLILILI